MFDGIAPLQSEWQRLEAFNPLPTQGFAFAGALQALAGPGQMRGGHRVLAVREAGRISAIAPLCRGWGPLARWRLLGARELSEPVDGLYDSAEAAGTLAGAMVRQGRPLSLDRVPVQSELVAALRRAMRWRGLVLVRPARPAPRIALTAQWREPESCFNAGRRSDFRRAARRAAEFGALAYEVIAPDPAEFDALFDEAIRIEQCGWKLKARTAIAADPAKERFFRRYLRACCEAGTLRIAFLRIGGQAVAMQLAMEAHGRFWLLKIGYDEAYSRCSPGTLLMLHTLRHAAMTGLSSYELLGNDEPWIAELWTREQAPCLRLRTYPWGLRGALALAVDGAAWLRERAVRAARLKR
ncbi:MAG TPA: GNAT family N-acetyltransferase [Novosphingobium sp.]|nr:GNAT family N-acetyltransferase [Novosphingobium sp.]